MFAVRFVLFCRDMLNDFLSKNCPFVAGAIAFYTLFSIFPLALAMVSIVGYLISPNPEDTRLANDIAEVLPVSKEFIGDTLQGVARARAITGIASVVGLIAASTAVFGAIRKGINSAWGITKTRPFIKERLIDLALVLFSGLVVIFVLFVAPLFAAYVSDIVLYFAPGVGIAHGFLGLAGQLTTPLLYFLTFVVLYRYLPNTNVRFADVWFGALFASIAFGIANFIFVWYVTRFPIYNVVYGSVGAIMALLTWVYVSAIILLLGALVTSRYTAYVQRSTGVQGVRLLWAGLLRVRLRVMVAPDAG